MSAHVSVFDLKRFAEARLAPEELPSFEQHLEACASCAGRLQQAATRELHKLGLDSLLGEPARRPLAGVLIAAAASVLFALSLGQGPIRFPPHSAGAGPHEPIGSSPLNAVPADAGFESFAFFDGGPRR